MNEKTFKTLVIAFSGLAAVAIASAGVDAAQYTGKAIRKAHRINTYNCTNAAFYEGNRRWCDIAYRVGYVKAVPSAERMDSLRREAAEMKEARRERTHAQAFPPVQAYDEVTTSHDHQGVYDGGSTNTPTIRLQTAENVANSSPYYAAAAIWTPGAVLGVQRVARAVPVQNRQVVEVRTNKVVTTTQTRRYVPAEGAQDVSIR